MHTRHLPSDDTVPTSEIEHLSAKLLGPGHTPKLAQFEVSLEPQSFILSLLQRCQRRLVQFLSRETDLGQNVDQEARIET